MKVHDDIRLNSTQKRVLTKIVAAPTARVAGDQISDNQNMIEARDLLVNLGMIRYEDGQAELTDTGNQVLKDYALVDDSGELTQDGQQLAYTDGDGQSDQDIPKTPASSAPPGMPESEQYKFKLLKELFVK